MMNIFVKLLFIFCLGSLCVDSSPKVNDYKKLDRVSLLVLKNIVESNCGMSWKHIADIFAGQSGIVLSTRLCRDLYFANFGMATSGDSWSRAEDVKLCGLVSIYGRKFVTIMRFMPNRSSSALKARYSKLIGQLSVADDYYRMTYKRFVRSAVSENNVVGAMDIMKDVVVNGDAVACIKFIQLLMSGGVDVATFRYDDGSTLLHHAVMNGYKRVDYQYNADDQLSQHSVMSFLVNFGMDINAIDNDGNTPLNRFAHSLDVANRFECFELDREIFDVFKALGTDLTSRNFGNESAIFGRNIVSVYPTFLSYIIDQEMFGVSAHECCDIFRRAIEMQVSDGSIGEYSYNLHNLYAIDNLAVYGIGLSYRFGDGETILHVLAKAPCIFEEIITKDYRVYCFDKDLVKRLDIVIEANEQNITWLKNNRGLSPMQIYQKVYDDL